MGQGKISRLSIQLFILDLIFTPVGLFIASQLRILLPYGLELPDEAALLPWQVYLLAVHPDHQGKGCGGFMLDHLKEEAASRHINYLYNTVRPAHPEADRVTAWFKTRGFEEHDDGVLRLAVHAASG